MQYQAVKIVNSEKYREVQINVFTLTKFYNGEVPYQHFND